MYYNNIETSKSIYQDQLTRLFLLLVLVYFSCFSVLSFIKGRTLEVNNEISEETDAGDDESDELFENLNKQITVNKSELINILLHKHRVVSQDILQIVEVLKENKVNSKLMKGSRVTLSLVEDYENEGKFGVVKIDIYNPSNSTRVYVTKQAEGFKLEQVIVELKKGFTKIKTQINGGVFNSLKNLNIPTASINEIISAYSHQIDFQRQVQAGDNIELIIEKYNDNNEFSHYGDIVLARLNIAGQNYELYRYAHLSDSHEYFSQEGKSVKRNLLKTPVKAAKISSHYGARVHPIHGYTKMHKGIDFAAPKGTPIYSAGEGVITEMGYKCGYGNYVKVKHSSHLSTLYAHVSKFHQGLKVGHKIKQGKTIAYVGATGSTTGPHLHYEVHINGRQVNPLSIKTLSDTVLKGVELAKFTKHKSHIQEVSKFLENNETYLVSSAN